MTEPEWLTCTDLGKMIGYLLMARKLYRGKNQFFACACCRQIWNHMIDPRSRKAVEFMEEYLDGADFEDEREQVALEAKAAYLEVDPYSSATANLSYERELALHAARTAYFAVDEAPWMGADISVAANYAALTVGLAAAIQAGERYEDWRGRPNPPFLAAYNAESARLCGLFRCIYGNPFRPSPKVPAACRPCERNALYNNAVLIYEERAFERLPLLADALEAAGCTDQDILAHCREPGQHARGCWVIDLLLYGV